MAYGWQPDTEFGTTPLWQANLTTGTTLKTAQYNYLHTDHLGTVQLATDSTGQVTWKAVSEAFGKTILEPINKITMNLRFPGQYYDQETGTHYNYFRDYNPNIGRYNESDPIGLFGGINTYAYVGGNPIRWSDYYGLQWKKKFPANHPNCIGLKNKINGLLKENDKRVLGLLLNKHNLPFDLPWSTLPRETILGHIDLLNKARDNLKYLQDRYRNECDDEDGPPTSPLQNIQPAVMAPSLPAPSIPDINNTSTVTEGGVLLLFIIYLFASNPATA